MSYTSHTWVDNESITKEKMNNIEEGIGEAAQSGEYDAVFNVNSYDAPVLISGTFSACMNKVRNYQPLNFALVSDYGEGYYYLHPVTYVSAEFTPSEYGTTNAIFISYCLRYHYSDGKMYPQNPRYIEWTENAIGGDVNWYE